MGRKGFPYYWGAIAVTKCISAVVLAFLPGENADRARVDTCSGWLRHMGRFYESGTYTFAFDAYLTGGDAEVFLLDQEKQVLLRLNRYSPYQSIYIDGENSRYYLHWEFDHASGECELRW